MLNFMSCTLIIVNKLIFKLLDNEKIKLRKEKRREEKVKIRQGCLIYTILYRYK